VVRSVLEDSISTTRVQFPLRPILYGLPNIRRGNGMIGSGAGRGPGGPLSAAEDSPGVDGLLGLFFSRVGGGASGATATGGAGACASRYT